MTAPTKDRLTARSRGAGGTLVRIGRIVRQTPAGPIVHGAGVYVVKDLFDRPTYRVPGRIAIGPVDRGVAFGVALDEIAEVL